MGAEDARVLWPPGARAGLNNTFRGRASTENNGSNGLASLRSALAGGRSCTLVAGVIQARPMEMDDRQNCRDVDGARPAASLSDPIARHAQQSIPSSAEDADAPLENGKT